MSTFGRMVVARMSFYLLTGLALPHHGFVEFDEMQFDLGCLKNSCLIKSPPDAPAWAGVPMARCRETRGQKAGSKERLVLRAQMTAGWCAPPHLNHQACGRSKPLNIFGSWYSTEKEKKEEDKMKERVSEREKAQAQRGVHQVTTACIDLVQASCAGGSSGDCPLL